MIYGCVNQSVIYDNIGIIRAYEILRSYLQGC
jgi:hypothetical protein